MFPTGFHFWMLKSSISFTRIRYYSSFVFEIPCSCPWLTHFEFHCINEFSFFFFSFLLLLFIYFLIFYFFVAYFWNRRQLIIVVSFLLLPVIFCRFCCCFFLFFNNAFRSIATNVCRFTFFSVLFSCFTLSCSIPCFFPYAKTMPKNA